MTNVVTLTEVKAAFAKHGHEFLSYDDSKVGGKTLKNNRSGGTYLTIVFKMSDGRVIKKPEIDIGIQILGRVSASVPFALRGKIPDEKVPEMVKTGELILDKPEMRFRLLEEKDIVHARPQKETESDTKYARNIALLLDNNKLLVEVLDILHESAEKLTESLSRISPKELGFEMRNSKAWSKSFFGKKEWVPPAEAENGHISIKISHYTVKHGEDAGNVVSLDTPTYKVRITTAPSSPENPVPLIKHATWGPNKKKDQFVPLLYDAVAIANKAENTELTHDGEPITTNNIKEAIPPKSTILGAKIEIADICTCPSGDTSFRVYLTRANISKRETSAESVDDAEYCQKYASILEDYDEVDTVVDKEVVQSDEYQRIASEFLEL